MRIFKLISVVVMLFIGSDFSFGQNSFSGSVPVGKASSETIQLSLKDAIDKGLHQNLGLLLAEEEIRSARGERWQDLSEILPNITAAGDYNRREVDIKAQQGISFPGIPEVVGPFHYVDLRAFLTQSIDWKSIQQVRSDSRQLKAAEFFYHDARELVVLAVSTSYFQTLADSARVDTALAQRDTAQSLYQQANDQLTAGTTSNIDVLRSRVEMQSREQQLIAARNDFAKQKLVLARIIGLPPGQEFLLSDKAGYEPIAQISVETALQRAYDSRADYKSLQNQQEAAELARKAAAAGYYPYFSVGVDYGKVGVNPSELRATTNISAALHFPIFEGGKVQGDILKAEARLRQSQQQLDNLRAEIDQEVRSALLDLQSAGELVKVAQSLVELADQTLQQAKDRFSSGVGDNIEVVQAQQSVAAANESLISSLYKYNVAKIELARTTGEAESGLNR